MVDYRVGINESSAQNLKRLLKNKIPLETNDLLDTLSSEAYLTAPTKSKGSRVTLSKLVGILCNYIRCQKLILLMSLIFVG